MILWHFTFGRDWEEIVSCDFQARLRAIRRRAWHGLIQEGARCRLASS